MLPEQAQVRGEWGWCSLEVGAYEGGGELGKGETGPGGGQEAGEEGSQAWDVPHKIGGGKVDLILQGTK